MRGGRELGGWDGGFNPFFLILAKRIFLLVVARSSRAYFSELVAFIANHVGAVVNFSCIGLVQEGYLSMRDDVVSADSS